MVKKGAAKKSGDAFRAGTDIVKVGAAKNAVKKGLLSSVVYLGHIPHGFYEKQMRGFFSQFGAVAQLRLARSKKSTRSKGYAFIKFEDPKVAIIVANTMDKYLLFGNTLQCNVLKQEDVHPNMFKGADKPFRKVPWRDIAKKRQNAPRTAEQTIKITKRLIQKDNKKRKKLEALGIKYDFEGYGQADALEDVANTTVAEQPKKSTANKKRKSPLKGTKSDEDPASTESQDEEPAKPKRTRKTPAKKAAATKPKSTPAKRATAKKATPALRRSTRVTRSSRKAAK